MRTLTGLSGENVTFDQNDVQNERQKMKIYLEQFS